MESNVFFAILNMNNKLVLSVWDSEATPPVRKVL